MTLKELNIGESAVIETVGGQGALRQHFLDMGLIPGEKVTLVKFAPMGDPMELQIHGYALTLRLDDAAQINVSPAKTVRVVPAACPEQKVVEHPGLGEGGRYHTKKGENPLPDGTTLTFALAGNQNCGKTTLFNQLTGSNQHVGNFPGVTVDRKSGAIRNNPNTEVSSFSNRLYTIFSSFSPQASRTRPESFSSLKFKTSRLSVCVRASRKAVSDCRLFPDSLFAQRSASVGTRTKRLIRLSNIPNRPSGHFSGIIRKGAHLIH